MAQAMHCSLTMNCPYYEERNFRYCKAVARRILIPSRTDKEECCCEGFEDCPYYQEHCRAEAVAVTKEKEELDEEDKA